MLVYKSCFPYGLLSAALVISIPDNVFAYMHAVDKIANEYVDEHCRTLKYIDQMA